MAEPEPVQATTSTTTPPQDVAVIEADVEPDASDLDSSLGDDAASSTASVTSSIFKYREENGRTYHAYKDGKYVLPNDATEQERLQLQHHLFLLTFDNKLFLSPAGKEGPRLSNVLDVGTGTGDWAVDFADEFPDAAVVGVDLSPTMPAFVPANVTFQVDDLEEPWTFSQKFDFIYSRMMTVSFADWPKFFDQCYNNLTPGGWLEVADIYPITSDDGTLDGTDLQSWVTQLLDGTTKIGRPFDGASQYKRQLEERGFKNVQQFVFKWPQNRWPKDEKYKALGTWTYENISSGLEGLSAAVYTRVLGWTKPELDVFLANVRKDMKDPRIHSYWPIYVVYGQKPEE